MYQIFTIISLIILKLYSKIKKSSHLRDDSYNKSICKIKHPYPIETVVCSTTSTNCGQVDAGS